MLSSFAASASDRVSFIIADSRDEVEEAGFGRRYFREAAGIAQGFWATDKPNGMVTQPCRTCVGVIMLTNCGAVAMAHISDRYADEANRVAHLKSMPCIPMAKEFIGDTLHTSLQKMATSLPAPVAKIVTVGGRTVDRFESFCRNAYLMLFFHNWLLFMRKSIQREDISDVVNILRSIPPHAGVKIGGIPEMEDDPVSALTDGDIMRQMCLHVLTPSFDSFGGMTASEVLTFMAVSIRFKIMKDAEVIPRIKRVASVMPRVRALMSDVKKNDLWEIVKRVEMFAREKSAYFQAFRTLSGDGTMPLIQNIASKGLVIAMRKVKTGQVIVCIAEEESFEHLCSVTNTSEFATTSEFNAFRGLLIRSA